MTKRTFSALALLASLTLPALTSADHTELSSTSAEPLRLISVGANVTELLFALQADDNVVAIDSTSRHYDPQGSFPQVGYHRQLSSEGLLALTPSHLIGSDEMGPDTTLHQLKASGVEVVQLAKGDEQAQLFARIDQLASLTQRQPQAEQLKQQLARQITELAQQRDSLHSQPAVLFLMLSEGRSPNVAGSNTPVDTIIALAGGHNPARQHFSSYKALSIEAIVEQQPQYLLVAERTVNSYGGVEQILAKHPLLAATPAGARGQIISVPSHALIGDVGPASLALASALSQRFHKDAY